MGLFTNAQNDVVAIKVMTMITCIPRRAYDAPLIARGNCPPCNEGPSARTEARSAEGVGSGEGACPLPSGGGLGV